MSNSNNNSTDNLAEIIEDTLKNWLDDDLANSQLRHLYLARSLMQQKSMSVYDAVKKIIGDAIDYVESQQSEVGALLRGRYFERQTARMLSVKHGMAESTLFNTLSYGRLLLERRIRYLEEEVKKKYLTEFTKRMESRTYSTLVGMENSIKKLSQLILSDQPPWIISIEGIGGIGKTALADATVRHLLDRGLIYDLAWVTARQSIFSPGFADIQKSKPALTSEALLDAIYTQLVGLRPNTFTHKDVVAELTRRFKAAPYLIIIDNLETVVDVDELLPTLRGLANPTRFLLTTRYSLFGHPDIYPIVQEELSKEDTLRLFRQEASTHNLPTVEQASDAELMPILNRTGGNPLAIKLAVGLLHLHSLRDIVADMISTRSSEVNQLYDYIYKKAWEKLSKLEQNSLLAMPLVDELGGTLDDLAGISRINRNDLHTAIEKLCRINLVNRRGDLHASLYTIHGLTRSFIHRQLVEWKE